MKAQGGPSPGEAGLGWLRFEMFHHTASRMKEHPKSKSTQPRFARRLDTLYLVEAYLPFSLLKLASPIPNFCINLYTALYRVTQHLVPNLPLTFMWKFRFSMGPCTKTQLLFSCQQEAWNNLNGHPVLFPYCSLLDSSSKNLLLGSSNAAADDVRLSFCPPAVFIPSQRTERRTTMQRRATAFPPLAEMDFSIIIMSKSEETTSVQRGSLTTKHGVIIGYCDTVGLG